MIPLGSKRNHGSNLRNPSGTTRTPFPTKMLSRPLTTDWIPAQKNVHGFDRILLSHTYLSNVLLLGTHRRPTWLLAECCTTMWTQTGHVLNLRNALTDTPIILASFQWKASSGQNIISSFWFWLCWWWIQGITHRKHLQQKITLRLKRMQSTKK